MTDEEIRDAVAKNKSAPCELCGRFGAVEIGGRYLCVDCYGSCGSCCTEFADRESD